MRDFEHECTDTDELLDAIVDEIAERLQAGDDVELDEYVARCPQCESQLRGLLPAMRVLHLAASEGGADSGQRPLQGTIGDYDLVGEVGRGGMGVVYEARQISLDRRVALKIFPMAGVLDPRHLKRFKREAQAAAGLHHSNIVPVYGVGNDRGVHFYAMQFIDGQTLAEIIRGATLSNDPETQVFSGSHASFKDAAADRKGEAQRETTQGATLETVAESRAERTSRFRTIAEIGSQVAAALQHAHDEAVIHRDIKPSNLIRDEDGRVWVADFGLAVVDGDPGLTVTGDLVGTVRYMSPEQALGKQLALDHRTDIYSLGATLYELLTRRPVFDGSTRQDVLRQIAFDDPRAPRSIDGTIPVELETIILKSLAKAPEERYPSAEEMQADLQRFLDDEPIRARRPSTLQRIVKWGRRNRPLVVSSAMCAIILVVMGIAGLLYNNMLVRGERDAKDKALNARLAALDEKKAALQRAEDNYFTARDAVDRMLTRIASRELAHLPHAGPLRQRILQDALEFYQRFVQINRDVKDDDVVREALRAYARVAEIQIDLGQLTDAESSCRNLLKDAARLSEPQQTLVLNERATALHILGRTLFAQGRHHEARKAYDQSAAVFETLIRQEPDNPKFEKGLAACHNNLGNVLERLGERVAAMEHVRASLKAHKRLVGMRPNELSYQDQCADIHCNLAGKLAISGQTGEAEHHFRLAVDYRIQLREKAPDVPRYRLGMARTHLGLVSLLKQNDPDAAEHHLDLAEEVLTALVAEHSSTPRYRRELARCYSFRGILAEIAGDDLAAAKQSYQRSLALQQQLVKEVRNNPWYRAELIQNHKRLAHLKGELSAAERERHLRAAVEAASELATRWPKGKGCRRELARCHFLLGRFMHGHDNPKAAVDSLREAKKIETESTPGGQHSAVPEFESAEVQARLGWALLDLQDADAIPCLQDAERRWAALATTESDKDPCRWIQARCLQHLGLAHARANAADAAENAFRQCVEIMRSLVDSQPDSFRYQITFAAALTNCGEHLASKGQAEQAQQLLEESLRVQTEAGQRFPKHVDRMAPEIARLGDRIVELQRAE